MTGISTGKRMSAHVEQMKQENGEAEAVMTRRSNKPAKRAPVKLRGGKQCYTNITGKGVRSRADLERVAVNQHHRSICSDEQIAMINIAYDMPVLMNARKSPCDIGRNMG